jgi:hypothetical protein
MAINNSINNTVGGSNSGATNTFTVTNSSNTASSVAHEVISVGGASAGDAFTTYTVTGVTNWSLGIDNSDSDNFILSASTALGTTNVLTATTAGAVQCVLGDFAVGRSSSGGTVQSAVVNGSNTANSDAKFVVQQGGPSGGDAYIQFQQTGGGAFTLGNDTSAGKFVLSANASLGTSNVISVNPNGEINYPLQSSFFAINTLLRTDVTGDLTSYNIICNSEIYDQNSDYDETTGTFEAPVSGRYLFAGNVSVAQMTSGVYIPRFRIVASNRRVDFVYTGLFPTDAGQSTFSGCAFVDMDAADICNLVIIITGGTKTIDVTGEATNATTSFSGQLMA